MARRDRFVHGGDGGDLADALLRVHDGDGAGVDHRLGAAGGLHDAGAQAFEIPGGAEHAVGLVAPEVGLDQAVGDEGGVVRRDAAGGEEAGDEGGEGVRDRRLGSWAFSEMAAARACAMCWIGGGPLRARSVERKPGRLPTSSALPRSRTGSGPGLAHRIEQHIQHRGLLTGNHLSAQAAWPICSGRREPR